MQGWYRRVSWHWVWTFASENKRESQWYTGNMDYTNINVVLYSTKIQQTRQIHGISSTSGASLPYVHNISGYYSGRVPYDATRKNPRYELLTQWQTTPSRFCLFPIEGVTSVTVTTCLPSMPPNRVAQRHLCRGAELVKVSICCLKWDSFLTIWAEDQTAIECTGVHQMLG